MAATMSEAVIAAIRALARDGLESDAAFDLVAPALQEFGEDDLAERVMKLADSEPWEGIAAFLSIASWDVSPPAESRIFRTAESWLLAADELRRVQVALHLDVIPFSKSGTDPALLARVLEKVCARFPETSSQCRDLLAQAAIVTRGRESDS
jgi:hypothetical protein